MFSGFSALAYLEFRQIVNRIKLVARRPGRLLIYVFAIGYFVFAAVYRSRNAQAFARHAVPEPYASAIFLAYVVLLGILAYGAASGIVGTFSSSADALFLTRSKIPERIVVVWLQLRRSAVTLLRMSLLLLYAILFARPGTVSATALAFTGGALIASAQAVPVLKLRSLAGARTAQSLAAAIAAAGLLPLSILLSSLVSASSAHAARGVEHLGAGFAFNALLGGNQMALAALFAFAAMLVAVSFALGNGLFADLYAASMKALNYVERAKRGGGAMFAIEHSYRKRDASSSEFIFSELRGPWTIAWKEWIAFRRAPSMQRLFALGLIACVVAGGLFGRVAAASHNPLEQTIVFAYTSANMLVILIAMGSAIGLASDLRKPLWWMGSDPLWIRLVAWMAGTSWRLALCLAAGITAWAVAMRSPGVAAAGIPIALAAVLQLRGVGLLLYALFPSNIDQRGPLAFVRALLTYLFAMPPAVIAIGVAFVFHNAGTAVTLAIGVSLAETALLVALASARISGRGVAFAQAEAL